MSSVIYRLPDGTQLLASTVYTLPESHSVVILIFISCISLVGVVGLLTAILISAVNTRKCREEHLFVRSKFAPYFICLLLFNLVQAIASVTNAVWVSKAGVSMGAICSFQGFFMHAADLGIATWTVVISGYTFSSLFLGSSPGRSASWGVLVGGWAFICSFLIFGPATANVSNSGPFHGISGPSCWISPHYQAGQIILDRFIVFLTAVLNVFGCIVTFARQRGHFAGNEGGASQRSGDSKDGAPEAKRLARSMLVYPMAYIIIVLPLIASQFAIWAGNNVSIEVTTFCAATFLLSGPVNVILFVFCRPVLPPGSWKIGWSYTPQDPGGGDGHRRNSSTSSSTTTTSIGTKTKLRPPDIIITRDSLDSWCSVYDEEAPAAQGVLAPRSAPVRSSYWSPEERHKRLPV